MFTRVLFALSILAIIALLWAGISMAQHVRRARRRRRRAQRTDIGVGSGILAIPDRPPATEAGFSFAELTPYTEAAVSRIESPAKPLLTWVSEDPEAKLSGVEQQPGYGSDPYPSAPDQDHAVEEPTYEYASQFADSLTPVDARQEPRPASPEFFAEEIPVVAADGAENHLKASEASFDPPFHFDEPLRTAPHESLLNAEPSVASLTSTPESTPISESSQLQLEPVQVSVDDGETWDGDSRIAEEPEILFRTLNIVREPVLEPEVPVVEVQESSPIEEAALHSPENELTDIDSVGAAQKAESALPEPTATFGNLPKPPQSSAPKPIYARLGKKLARPDWDYFNKDMGDLTDPYESPRARSKDRTGT